MGCHMDYDNDTATILGQVINLDLTSSGHYCVSLGGFEEAVCEESVLSVELTKLEGEEAFKALKNIIVREYEA